MMCNSDIIFLETKLDMKEILKTKGWINCIAKQYVNKKVTGVFFSPY